MQTETVPGHQLARYVSEVIAAQLTPHMILICILTAEVDNNHDVKADDNHDAEDMMQQTPFLPSRKVDVCMAHRQTSECRTTRSRLTVLKASL